MAEKYCDHGAYGAYAAVPTWGAAQDGDGTAKAVGTPSTAEVVFTGIASTGVIAVLGQTITFTRATDANTCANNLASAINASTATATGPASFTTKSQVRNHLYARGPSSGAPAGTCQIMTRQASAAHAGLIAITHTLNNVSSPATINFAGGTGGCWGTLINELTQWSTFTRATYGVWSNYGGTPFLTGSLAGADVVYVRSNKDITINTNQVFFGPGAMGSREAPVEFQVDNGTQWPADGATPRLNLRNIASGGGGGQAWFGSISSACYARVISPKYGEDDNGLQLFGQCTYQNGGGDGAFFVPWGHVKIYNVSFFGVSVSGTFTSAGIASPNGGDENYTMRAEAHGCLFRSAHSVHCVWNGTKTTVFLASGCTFDSLGTSAPAAGFITVPSYNSLSATFFGCKFKNFIIGSRLQLPSIFGTNQFGVSFVDCDFGGVTIRSKPFHAVNRYGPLGNFFQFVSVRTRNGSGDFMLDHSDGISEWNSSASYPTLNAVLQDGVTPWSILLLPSTDLTRNSHDNPSAAPDLSKVNTLGNTRLRATVEVCIEKNLAWTHSDICMVGFFEGATGSVSVAETPARGALTVSTAAWTQIQLDPDDAVLRPTYSLGGTLRFNRYKLVLETIAPVRAGSIVSLSVRVNRGVADVSKIVFIDPEVVLEAIS